MERALVILTNRFPFDTGEEYLEAELPILAERFASIVVVPLMTTAASARTRRVPEGVSVVDPRAELGTLGRVREVLTRAPLEARGWAGLRGLPRLRRPDHAAFDVYFEARAQAALRAVLAHEGRIRPAEGVPVTIYSYWFYLTARVGVALAQRWRATNEVRLISRGHGYDVNEAASAVGHLPLRRFLLEHVDALHPVAETTSRRLRREHPDHAATISTRRLGSARPDAPVRADQAARRLVTVSAVRPLKRLPLVADAVELLRQDHPDLTWTHFGAGRGRYARRTRERILQQLGPATVDFRGHQPNAAVHAWYAATPATAFVNVSTSEGVPVSVMEAMSHGLPVVATDVGGTAELFTPSMFDGLLPADLTAEDLAARLHTLLTSSPDAYAAASAASVEAWRAQWDAEQNFRSFAEELAAP